VGNTTASGVTGFDDNPWRYAAGYQDNNTGLIKFGTRYYDPTIGRWTQPDPIAGDISQPNTINRYAYVGSDPINGVDPTGQNIATDIVGGILTIGGAAAGVAALVVSAPVAVGVLTVVGVGLGAASVALYVGCAFSPEC
jgi:RHS repeat-associated protein